MKRILFVLVLVAACICLGATVLVAQGHDHEDQMQDDDTAAYIQQYMEAIAPGGHHKAFELRVREWQAEIRQWQMPDAEPVVSKGKASNEVVMGGRYLLQHLEANVMGMPYVGMGVSGFDKTIGKHTTFWVDNMGTSATYSEGECSEHCKQELYLTWYADPVSGEAVEIKMITKIVDDNHHIFEMHQMGPDGKMFKSMEINYTRS